MTKTTLLESVKSMLLCFRSALKEKMDNTDLMDGTEHYIKPSALSLKGSIAIDDCSVVVH